jgi:hypothetical protein
MRCEDAAEFVSALCDGEKIPREVAGHLGTCETCAGRLASYSALGAELRRIAGLDQPTELKYGVWEERPRMQSSWWRKGRESIRIPRFVFASMLAAIFLLSGGLVMVRARANAAGPYLWLTAKLPPDGEVVQSAALSTDGLPGGDRFAGFGSTSDGGSLSVRVHFLRREGDRVELGVKTLYESPATHFHGDDNVKLNRVPEQSLWIEPGKNAEVSVPGLGSIEFTGDFVDHKPPSLFSQDDTVDPRADEFRIVSPVLIRGKEVIFDIGSASATVSTGGRTGISVYLPGEGRFMFSPVPFKDAVKCSVFASRIRFTANGRDFVLLTAVPVTRGDIWVRLEPGYKRAEENPPVFGVESLSDSPKE